MCVFVCVFVCMPCCSLHTLSFLFLLHVNIYFGALIARHLVTFLKAFK